MLAQTARRLSARLPAAATVAPRAATLRTSAPRLAEGDSPSSTGGLTLNFAVPTDSLYSGAQVEMVILPSSDGQFGVMPSHVPTIAELKPGVVSVQEEAGGPLIKYFVSGGFASMTDASKLNVTVLEAVAIDDIDADAVKTGLAQYSAAYASATEDYAKSEAEIGVEVYSALSYAISEA